MSEITFKKVAVKSSTKTEDGKKVRVEVDRIEIPVYPTLESIVDALGEKEVLELANRQNATDLKNKARQEATREYSEAGYQKLALQRLTDMNGPDFMDFMTGIAKIKEDSNLTPEAKSRAMEELKQRKIAEIIDSIKNRKIVKEFDDDVDAENEDENA